MHLKYITSHFPGFSLTLASPGARTLYESKDSLYMQSSMALAVAKTHGSTS